MATTSRPTAALTLLLALLTTLASADLTRRSALAHVPHVGHLDRVAANASTVVDTPKSAYSVGPGWTGTTTVTQSGTTGVSAMQLAVVSNNGVVILDKVEHNPLQVNGQPAWGQFYNVATGKAKAFALTTNSFCAGGAHLSNGTLVSLGGDPPSGTGIGDHDGQQAVRIFNGCTDSGCSLLESPTRIRLGARRWYPSTARLPDGSIFVIGGMVNGAFNDVDGLDTSSIEYYPSKDINNGLPVPSQFLRDALPSNLFPITYLLPDNTIFVAANKLVMIYDWQNNKERRLPSLPTRINYPWTAASALLPLSSANNYTPEIVICGGSNQPDNVDPSTLSSQAPTVAQCYRMVLNDAGIAAGWNMDDVMPYSRVMPEAVLMADGKLLLVNGAQTGVAGYGNVGDQIGASNADNPALQPVLYDPAAPIGSRFTTTGFTKTAVARMYHSVASLLPDGRIMLAGSNPNGDVSTNKYQTEYRIEYLMPPYLSQKRPSYTGLASNLRYGKTFKVTATLPSGTTTGQITIALMDLGYKTHGVAFDQRLVNLDVVSLSGKILTIRAPPSANVYPPGPAFLYVLVNGVPSVGQRVMMGPGAAPPFSKSANANMLANTGNPPTNARAVPPGTNGHQERDVVAHGPLALAPRKRRNIANGSQL